MRNRQTRNRRTSRQPRNKKIAAQLDFIRSLKGSLKGGRACQFLMEERRRDNARGK